MAEKQPKTLEEIIKLFTQISEQDQTHLSAYITVMTAGQPGTLIQKSSWPQDWAKYNEKLPITNPTARKFLEDVQANKNDVTLVTNAQIAAALFKRFFHDSNTFIPNYDMIILKKLKEIKDPEIQMTALRHGGALASDAIRNEYRIAIANNPNSTAIDHYDLMARLSNSGQKFDAMPMYENVYAKASAEFQAQAESDAPNTDTMKNMFNIIMHARDIARLQGALTTTEANELAAADAKKFDIQAAILGKQEYFAGVHKNSQREKIELKKKLSDAEQQLSDKDSELQTTQRALNRTQKKVDALASNIDALNQQIADLESKIKKLKLTAGQARVYEKLLQNIIDESQNLGTGLLGKNGISATKQAIAMAAEKMPRTI